MLAYNLPPRSARQISAGAVEKILHNGLPDIAGGGYFGTITLPLFIANPGMVYYVDRLSWVGDLTQTEYVQTCYNSLALAGAPNCRIVDSSGQTLNGSGLPLVSYMDNRPYEMWLSIDRGGQISAVVDVALKQVPSIVPVAAVYFSLAVTAYEMSSNEVAGAFRAGLSPRGTVDMIRGGR